MAGILSHLDAPLFEKEEKMRLHDTPTVTIKRYEPSSRQGFHVAQHGLPGVRPLASPRRPGLVPSQTCWEAK